MWTFLVDALAGSELVRWVVMGTAGLLGGIFWGRVQKRKGAKETQHKMEIKDHENADRIRDNVDRNLDDELRKHDGRGFRDRE